MEDDLRAFTVREAAERSSLSEVHLRRAIRRGDLEVTRIGRRILVPAWALRRYLEPRRVVRRRVPRRSA